MGNEKVAIYIVTHKAIAKPLPYIKKKGYHYIGVGPNKHDINVELTDDTGDNISEKNKNFCELTVQYWIWKNSKEDIVGLVHYRRFFYNPYTSLFRYHYLSAGKIKHLLKKYDVIVPKPSEIEGENVHNVYEQFCWAHNQRDIDEVGKIISEKYPQYVPAFEQLKQKDHYCLCNMMITSKKIYDDYSSFLFSVLFELEKRIDISSYDSYQQRVFGFLSERLLNVYLWAHPEFKIKYYPVLVCEGKSAFANFCTKAKHKLTR